MKASPQGRFALALAALAFFFFPLADIARAAQQPDLRLSVTDSLDPVSLGELLTYRLVVTNAGSRDATSVSLVSTLSTNTTFFSATSSQGSHVESGSNV